MTIDIKNFYLNMPMERYEYVRLKLTDIPDEIITQYNLHAIATTNGYIDVEIRKGMYGLPQAGLLAQQLLEKRLNEPCRTKWSLDYGDTAPAPSCSPSALTTLE